MLLIYTPEITERVKYTFALFFNQLIKTPYRITNSEAEFSDYNGMKFSYAPENKFPGAFFFQSSLLLFEKNIREQELHPLKVNHNSKTLIGFFEVKNSPLIFDVFASAFFLVSRYEEYISRKNDHMGRFKEEFSAAGKFDFLNKPMVNYYAQALKQILERQFPAVVFSQPEFTILNTVDVDMAWKYKQKGFFRNLFGFLRDIRRAQWNMVSERFSVLFLGKKDPFHSYEYIINQCKQQQIPLCFFWLLGKYSSLDKNITRENSKFRELIKSVSKKADYGVHLSFRGHYVKKSFYQEVTALSNLVNKKVTKNRFHFLKFDISKTFYKLTENGIKEEFSMGYSSKSGFRASIASPFNWFDLQINAQTDLLIHPLVFMDATIRYHNPMNDEQAIKYIDDLLQKIAEVNGQFVALWHNDIFDDNGNDWKMIFEWFNQKAASLRKA